MGDIPPLSIISDIVSPGGWEATVYVVLIVAALLLRVKLPASASRTIRFLREFLLVAPAALLYFLGRGLIDAREAVAVRHARHVLEFERSLGIDWERDLQTWIMNTNLLVDIVNWIYIWTHWPLIIATMSWLIFARHDRFPFYRNAFLIAGSIGMIIFVLYPVAPPRLIPDMDFIDTVTNRSHSYRVLQPPSLTNPYAAMPSLHFGWNLLMGIAVMRESRHWGARLFGVVMPIAMFASIVLTANHYILNGIVGGAIVLLSLWISQALWTSMHDTTTQAARRTGRLNAATVDTGLPNK